MLSGFLLPGDDMTTARWEDYTLGLVALLWALLLALPGDTLGQVRAYAAVARFLPDQAWAFVLALCGLLLVFGPDRLGWQAQAHLTLGILWAAIVFLILADRVTTGTGLLASFPAAFTLLHLFEFFKRSQLARL